MATWPAVLPAYHHHSMRPGRLTRQSINAMLLALISLFHAHMRDFGISYTFAIPRFRLAHEIGLRIPAAGPRSPRHSQVSRQHFGLGSCASPPPRVLADGIACEITAAAFRFP